MLDKAKLKLDLQAGQGRTGPAC